MTDWPLDLSRARILLSNDDGYDAPGLALLHRIARTLSDDVWVVAPETQQSGAGHSLTLFRPLRIKQRDERVYSVDGTPTDCVLLAVNQILADRPPDIVLSGVNSGANLGEDVTYSGTIAATFEATILGVPAIAFSQELDGRGETDWSVPEARLADLTRSLVERGWPRNTLINVNFPPVPNDAVTGVLATRQGRRKIGDHIAEARDPRGRPYYWIGEIRMPEDRQAAVQAGTDVAAIEEGAISVTPIHLDFTDRDTLADLTRVLA